jgi:hypothetical protein
MIQQIAAYALVAAAAAWIAYRYVKRRATGNCCGEAECPAANATARRITEAGRRR